MSQYSKKVSVVMSVYNEEEVVSEAIESILDQTYRDFEFVIVDDGSKDKTTEVIRSFTDDRIKVIENKTNKGLPFSLNKGIKCSKGKYIARMDADDRSLANRLDKQVKVLDSESHIHVVGTWAWILGVDGDRLGISQYKVGDCSPSEIKSSGPYVAHPSVMMRAESLQKVGGYRHEFDYAQDLDLWVRMAQIFDGQFILNITQPLIERRITPKTFKIRPVQRKFGKYAGNSDTSMINSAFIKQSVNIPRKSRQKYLYHFNAGYLAGKQNWRIKSLSHFLNAIKNSPYNSYPILGIFSLFLPNFIRNSVWSTYASFVD